VNKETLGLLPVRVVKGAAANEVARLRSGRAHPTASGMIHIELPQGRLCDSRAAWMQKRCEWCWGSCWDDGAGVGASGLWGGTDLRRGFVGLSGMVQTVLKENPFSGQVFVFRGGRGDLIKLLWWDGDGLCLFAKRLERGRFIWPQATSGTYR